MILIKQNGIKKESDINRQVYICASSLLSKIFSYLIFTMYVSENLDIQNFCSILYKFIEANQDKKGDC